MLYADKSAIDKYFKDNWDKTPILLDGSKIDTPNDGKWIATKIVLNNREQISFGASGSRTMDEGEIVVDCYDKSPTKCYNLAYEVQKFLECKIILGNDGKEILVGLGISDGNGALPLHNGIYETRLKFTIKKYN